MQNTPKSLRLHISLFGRTNVGKSSFLNLISGQDVAITSPEPGTTTDVVEKSMELLPIGPVVFLDTGGLDDASVLGNERIRRARKTMDRTDVVLLISDGEVFGEYEEQIIKDAKDKKLPIISIVNKKQNANVSDKIKASLRKSSAGVIECSAIDTSKRENVVDQLKDLLGLVLSDEFKRPPVLVEDLLPERGIVVLIVPIDIEAPKGRIILPQVQTIRNALDSNAIVIVVKENEYSYMLEQLKTPPALVICDSQVVDKMVVETPENIPCTTFSILFARLKADMKTLIKGAAAIKNLSSGDKILIAESCSHHAMEDDIGRVKIPRWLREFTGAKLEFDSCAGRDFPENLKDYKLVVQCGGCMNNRAEMLSRLQKAENAGVPITNYGLCISQTQGVLDRVIAPLLDKI